MQAVTVDEVANVHQADRHRFVTDQASVLSPDAVRRIDAALDSVWRSSTAEPVVVIVDRIDGDMTADEFATALFEKWGIGKKDKDNGLLLLMSVDDRRAVIRTGYGVEGAIPDITAGRIIRNDMIPYFRQGDYESGITAGVAAIVEKLTDPSVAEELHSALPSDRRTAAEDDDFSASDFIMMYLFFAAAIGGVALLWVIFVMVTNRGKNEVLAWRRLNHIRSTMLFLCFVTVGLALPAYLLLLWRAHRVRRHARNCPNCGTRMNLVDEEHDNDYLTPAQDIEEKLNSIDYDVWLCPSCHSTEVLPYVNINSRYSKCPRCGARAMTLVKSDVLVRPTADEEGVRINTYVCRACGFKEDRHSRIPREANLDGAVAGAVIGGILSGGRGSGGGGFSGGSFGGGLTGGGGASGGW